MQTNTTVKPDILQLKKDFSLCTTNEVGLERSLSFRSLACLGIVLQSTVSVFFVTMDTTGNFSLLMLQDIK